jgi:hypothetical protein
MNVENSKEADPLRAVAVDVALILSCIRASQAKRRTVAAVITQPEERCPRNVWKIVEGVPPE